MGHVNNNLLVYETRWLPESRPLLAFNDAEQVCKVSAARGAVL
jgi:hypothetical protein